MNRALAGDRGAPLRTLSLMSAEMRPSALP